MKKPRLATAAQGLLALALSIPAVPASAMLTDPLTVFTVPAFSKPAYLASIVDPTFQSTVTRLGNNIGSSTTPLSGTWGSDARHVYSKQQPWNSDQTLITTENRVKITVARKLLVKAGRMKPTKNGYNILFTIIKRSGKFKHVAPGEYQLLPEEKPVVLIQKREVS